MLIPSEVLIKIIQNVVIMLFTGGTFSLEKLAMTVGVDILKNIDEQTINDIVKKAEDAFNHTSDMIKEKIQGPEMSPVEMQTFVADIQKKIEDVYSI